MSLETTYTGSVDYFRYNKKTDQHDLIDTLYLRGTTMEVLLAAETGSDITFRDPLHTELGTYWQENKDLLIDWGLYYQTLEDGFGISLDMYGKLLVVGCPYYMVRFATDVITFFETGSLVDIFDLGLTESSSMADPFVYSLMNPDPQVSESFGIGVGINSTWLAVGSPLVSSSQGMVYIYENISTGSGNYSWSLFQKIEAPTPAAGQQFGRSVKVNKQSGAYSGSMVVGCGYTGSNEAYYFELTGGSWQNTYTFLPLTNSIYPLTFGNYPPFEPTMSVNSGYGYDVSLFDSAVIVGAYHDRMVYEYTGSPQFDQGAVYIYEKCRNLPYTDFYLALKTYGTPRILKNNRLGFSVDMWGQYAVAGIPKKTDEITPCYIGGTLGQLHYCEGDLEHLLQGQAMLLQKDTSSYEWSIVNIYQKKKRYLSPHRKYGFDVSLDGRSMVVGAPIDMSGSRRIDVPVTESSGVLIDDVSGKAYIYNFPNLREEWHVGNVFYRNGKIVVMTSGSAFEGLFFNPVSNQNYEYDLTFKGQRTVQEKQIMCTVDPGEFNVSTNPSAIDYVSSSLDLNRNGEFDFQDVDVLLRYLQYKKDSTTDWSSSLVTSDDELSFYNYNSSLWTNTDSLWSSSFYRFENVDTTFIDSLDINSDNKVNSDDMNILWKYFSRRLTDNNYAGWVNINSHRTAVNSAIEYLDNLSKREELPQIHSEFFNYDTLSAADKTGSFLAPMVTTIGLYDGLDLVAVAKLGSPIKLPKTLPTNFVVKMDF